MALQYLAQRTPLVACALASATVGIDIETVTRPADYHAIAHAHFSSAEAGWVTQHRDTVAERFVALWTIKEAYLKALGTGLALPIDRVKASHLGMRSCRVFSAAAHDGQPWFCRLAVPAPGFWLAVCYARALAQLDIKWATLQDERVYVVAQ